MTNEQEVDVEAVQSESGESLFFCPFCEYTIPGYSVGSCMDDMIEHMNSNHKNARIGNA